MAHSFTFAVVGGDRRSFYAAKRLREYGFETKIFGLENEETYDPTEKIRTAAVLLPIPFTKDGIHLFAPESKEKILISDVLQSVSENAVIFAGNANGVTDKRILNYGKRNDFALMNAVPTAEGALLLALQNGKTTVCGKKIGVIGFGRIASAVAKLFSAVGADVTVFARKEQARAEAHILGYTAKPISALTECAEEYELLMNTVPSKIFERDILKRIRKDSYIMELASAPFGVDFEEAASLGVRTLLASGLPGKYFPETAGCAVAETVLNVLREKQILI
ncbi:MAG: NAD(P)-binding domain-containing protein [Clostridia bacterium]|nr:NAD(P)-binding domain-containing protein [Clostridia bacterium]